MSWKTKSKVAVFTGGVETVYVEVGDIATFIQEQYDQMREALNSGKRLVVVDVQTDHYEPVCWTEMDITFNSGLAYIRWCNEDKEVTYMEYAFKQ